MIASPTYAPPAARTLPSLRWSLALLGAAAATLALFALMRALVAVADAPVVELKPAEPIMLSIMPDEYKPLPRIEIYSIEHDSPPPVIPPLDRSGDAPDQGLGFDYAPGPVGLDVELEIEPAPVSVGLPPLIFRQPPAYPVREASRGVEGACTVRFDILASGQTANIAVMACDSPGFARASVEAVARWRYAAEIGGRDSLVGVRGAEVTLDYRLEQ